MSTRSLPLALHDLRATTRLAGLAVASLLASGALLAGGITAATAAHAAVEKLAAGPPAAKDSDRPSPVTGADGASAEKGGEGVKRDSRADTSGLPEGRQPWWPSRYGADDQIGTLNELTPERVLAAMQMVKTGERTSLGRIIDENIPVFPGRWWRQSLDITPHITNLNRSDTSGQGWGKNEINWITEIQAGTFQVGTQIDSIGHIQTGDRFYNGWKIEDVVESWGLNRFGTESIPPVIGRGVLVDAAAAKAVTRLETGYVITVSDVEAALAREKVAIGPGDIVLFHTGWGGLWGVDNPRFLSGEPGPGLDLIRWLYDRHVAAVGTDSWSIGPVPGEDPARPFLVPQTMYVDMGLFGFENLATEELARRNIYEFLFVSTNARTRGSTAAFVAPAALF
ncbi:MAG: cyclase family protein [Rhodospirillales bacterium]|nr:cyclase family protein [Rhodospirillales bacterium]